MDKDRVFIVGGGPSIQTSDLKKLNTCQTIAVNKSAFFVPNPTHFITMDYTMLSKVGMPRITNLRASKHFVVNMSIDYIKSRNGVPTDIRYGIAYNQLFDVFDTIIVCRREDGLGHNFSDFRCGDNSGFCAFQLAFLLGYKKIYLMGFDMTVQGSRTHFHSGYREPAKVFNSKVTKYLRGFSIAIKEAKHKYPDVEIYSCSKISGLNEIIPYVDFNEVV